MDNYSAWLDEDLKRERWRESRPVCAFCKDHVQDEYKYVLEKLTGTVTLCESCAEEYAEELAEEYKQECLSNWRRENN